LTIVLSILIIIVILGILITVHEFGHFFTAKKCGIRVFEFAIGMGPKLWKKKKGETLYSIRAIPIGGFCNMGEDSEADPEDKHAFPNAKRRRRALVLGAGSLMNFVLGFLILLGLNLFYPPVHWAFTEPIIKEAEQSADDPAWSPYLQDGDRIVRLNGHALYNYQHFLLFLTMMKDKPMSLVVERDGQRITFNDMQKTAFEGEERYGFSHSYILKEPTLGLRIANGWHDTVHYTRLVWVTLGELFGGGASVTDMMGPVGMANVVDTTVQDPQTSAGEKTVNLIDLTALITVNLAVMNLLPIPGLDGSRLLFLAIEGVRRKKLNPKYEGYVHAVGMVLLFGLMIFVFFNDIVRWVGGGVGVG